jgi:membrane protease YdiL (CAAX protease family)
MSTLTVTSQFAPASPITGWLARHPILGYFAIAYGGTWGLLLVPVLAQNGIGLLPFLVPDIALMILFVIATLAGQTLGAIVMTTVTSGRSGLRHFFRRYVQVRVGLRWYLLVLLGYPLIGLLAASVYSGLAPFQAALAQWPVFFTAYLPAVLFTMLMPALAEEPGWRGYALPRLEHQYGPLPGTIIVGLLHSAWHLPVFFITKGIMAMGPFNPSSFFLTTLVMGTITTVIWAWVFNNAKGSIFMALVLHAANNVFGVPLKVWAPDAPASVDTVIYGLIVACALLIIIFTRGRLSYTAGLGLPATDTPAFADAPAGGREPAGV